MKNSQTLETKIREAKPEDFPRMEEISKKAFADYDPDTSGTILNTILREINLQIGTYFENPNKYNTWKKEEIYDKRVLLSQRFYVTEDLTKKVLGYAGIERSNVDGDAQGAFWVNWTAVDPEYQGRGIGKGLLIKLIEESKKIGATTLSVKTDSSPGAESGHKTYEKLGFKPTGRIPNYYAKGNDLIVYTLDLEKC